MQLPMLQIESAQAQLGFRSHRPHMQIKQRHADLQIDQEFAEINMSRTKPRLSIDQTEAFADANLKGALRQHEEFFQSGQRKYMEYLAKTVRQGDQLMRIEHGLNKYPQIIKQDHNTPPKQVEIGWMPRTADRIKINFQPSELKVDVRIKEPTFRVQINDPQIQIPKWQTDTYVKQKNSIRFNVVGGNVNKGL